MNGERVRREIQNYRDLEVWQEAMDLAVAVYRMTVAFPQSERFALTDQVHRAAVSVPSNIAEGHARLHRADFLRFLSVARGSLAELETQIEIAFRLNYLTPQQQTEILQRCRRVGRLLNGLIRSLRAARSLPPDHPTPDPCPPAPDPCPPKI